MSGPPRGLPEGRRLRAASRRLLSWFERSARTMDWRETDDPYRIWVSEIMLQQTRVDTVVPYYERFIERFPTVEALAEAPLDEVLARWSGLGYYRRARLLHRAACEVVARGFPRTARDLERLPGIGAYTAAAVASIAFGEAVPVLDGNVERVISRRLALDEPPRGAAASRRLRAAARELLDPERPGDSNQALMELGALVCRPRNPSCGECPLAAGCEGRARGNPEAYPRAVDKRATERQRRLAVLVERGGSVLLFRRPDDSDLLAGIWEIPWVPRDGGRPERRLEARYGGTWSLGETLRMVRHGITYRDLEVEVRRGERETDEEVAEGLEAGWFTRAEMASLPTSSLLAKLLG